MNAGNSLALASKSPGNIRTVFAALAALRKIDPDELVGSPFAVCSSPFAVPHKARRAVGLAKADPMSPIGPIRIQANVLSRQSDAHRSRNFSPQTVNRSHVTCYSAR